MIFGGDTELRDQEEEKLEAFRDYCKTNGITLPEGYDDENRFVLRVLQGKKWNHEVTKNEIMSHFEWKKAAYPLKYDPIKNILASGVIYGYKRDIKFRPVVIVNCQKILQMEVS